MTLGKEPDLSKCTDPHTVAGLLRLYFRELPEPLLTFDLYDSFIESHKKGVSQEQRVKITKQLVNQLPQPNQILLQFIIAFLARVVRFSDVNKMSKSNLGVIEISSDLIQDNLWSKLVTLSRRH